MKTFYSFLLLLTVLIVHSEIKATNLQVIPRPASVELKEGKFKVPQKWNVSSDLNQSIVSTLLNILNHPYEITGDPRKSNLRLIARSSLAEEEYELKVEKDCVTLEASTETGFFYGMQSLYQLAYLQNQGNGEIDCCEIIDNPRFEHRGLMLDVTRYFIPKEEVKRIIDVASALKLNRLHLHLTDDNGWRIEIKKYPKLTETGAWRVYRPEIFPGRKNQTDPNEPTPVGGFYTQEDLKEIVKYAAERHMEVIPEIEMPAHAAAAIASYPELACESVDKFVGVFPGIGGSDASIIMCAGNEKVYEFYRDVLDEVMEIFPSEYIHLGGDEANKRMWEECELCNKKLAEENLKDFEELQAYFMDTINHHVREKGRTAMGWDEVTYGDPKEDMVILGWQGDGNIAVKDARKSGRKFIMTPAKTLYLIRYQGPQWFEPFTYFGNNTLKDAYEYEAVKDDWTPELKEQLLGIQGSLWTEFCNSPEDVEYLVFPRLLGVADAAWRPEGTRDWESFSIALDNFLPELDRKGITYANSRYNIQHTAVPTGDGVELTLESIYPFADIKYSGFEGREKLQYEGPLKITESTKVKANTYKDAETLGQPLILEFSFNKATGKKVESGTCNNGLQQVLTNGLRGSNRISDFEWAGWVGKDAEFVIDLEEDQDIDKVGIGTIGFTHMCVVMPDEVELLASTDGKKYVSLGKTEIPEELVFAKEQTKHEIEFNNLKAKARYLKFIAKNPGRIPQGFARDGNTSLMYFDEVTVE